MHGKQRQDIYDHSPTRGDVLVDQVIPVKIEVEGRKQTPQLWNSVDDQVHDEVNQVVDGALDGSQDKVYRGSNEIDDLHISVSHPQGCELELRPDEHDVETNMDTHTCPKIPQSAGGEVTSLLKESADSHMNSPSYESIVGMY